MAKPSFEELLAQQRAANVSASADYLRSIGVDPDAPPEDVYSGQTEIPTPAIQPYEEPTAGPYMTDVGPQAAVPETAKIPGLFEFFGGEERPYERAARERQEAARAAYGGGGGGFPTEQPGFSGGYGGAPPIPTAELAGPNMATARQLAAEQIPIGPPLPPELAAREAARGVPTPVGPARMGVGGAAPVPLRDIASMFGGQYVPTQEEFEAKIAGLPPAQQAELRAKWNKLREGSLPGIQSKMLEQQLGGMGEQGAAMRDAALRQQKELADIIAKREAADAEARARQEQLLKIQADKKRVIDAQTARFETGVRDLENSSIDPDRIWAKKGTAGTIMSGIGMILSIIGDGYRGQKSQAMEAINKQIDDDIEAQKATIQAKASALSARSSLLGHFMNIYNDREQAATAAKAYAYERVGHIIENIGLKSQKDTVKADSDLAAKQFYRQAEQMKLMNKAQAIAAWQGNQLAAARAATAGKSLLKQPGWMEVKSADLQNYIPELGAMVHGSDPEVKQVRTTMRAQKTGLETIAALKQLAQTASSIDPTDEQKAMAGVYVKNLQLAIKEAEALGTLDKGSQEFLDTIVTNPTDVLALKDVALARLDAVGNGLRQKARAATVGLKVEPVDITTTTNAKGETVRVMRPSAGVEPKQEKSARFTPSE